MYVYDAFGQLVAEYGSMASATIARPGLALSQTFSYDAFNRLWTAAETGGSSEWSQTYGYDAFGNRAVTGGYIPNSGLTPTAIAQFTNNQWLGTGVSYDLAGNQKTLPSRTFTYDAENRVIAATEPNTGAISYVYDGEGKRVQKTVGTSVTTYVYDGFGQLAAEYATQATPGLLYLTADALGSTRLVTDASANALKSYDYLPFGEDLQQTIGGRDSSYPTGIYPSNPDIESQKFTGKERDAETGLDWFGFRYLSSAQGRFTSPDAPFADQHPEDPQSWNMYAYVRNNPLKNTDPNGRDCQNGVVACGNYILGGVGAVVNAFSSGIINLPNRVADSVVGLFNGGQRVFGDVVPDAFTPTNEDQRQGVQAANAVMLVSPLAEAGAAAVVEAIGTGARVEAGATAVQTGVQANKAVGDAFRDQVATGLAKEGRGVQTEVTKTTPFGTRRIDIEVSDKPGGKVLGGVETKTGNSPYKPSQRAKDEYLKQQGYPVNVVRKKPEDQ